MFRQFCGINFHVEIFSWSGATTKKYYHENVFALRWKNGGIFESSVFAAFTSITTSERQMLGRCLTVKESQGALRTGTLPVAVKKDAAAVNGQYSTCAVLIDRMVVSHTVFCFLESNLAAVATSHREAYHPMSAQSLGQ